MELKMENEIQIFENVEFGKVRTMVINDEPWFVGKDVAEALGYGIGKSLANAVANHVCDEDKGVTEMMTPGGRQNVTIINESGLYSLIFGSKLESAQKFKKWVTSEVLPSIRRTGSFSIQPKFNVPTTFAEALRLAADQQEKIEEQAKLLEEQKPKVEFFDTVADSKTAISMNDVAKVLGIKGMGRNNLFEFLRNEKILMSNNVPFQIYVDRGYFRVIEQKYMKNGEPCMNIKTLVYQKGVDFISKTIKNKRK
jgi:prophage antirepressor-like protein